MATSDNKHISILKASDVLPQLGESRVALQRISDLFTKGVLEIAENAIYTFCGILEKDHPQIKTSEIKPLLASSRAMMTAHIAQSHADQLRLFNILYQFLKERRTSVEELTNGPPITNRIVVDIMKEFGETLKQNTDLFNKGLEEDLTKEGLEKEHTLFNDMINASVDVIEIGEAMPAFIVIPQPNPELFYKHEEIPQSNLSPEELAERRTALIALMSLPKVCPIHPPGPFPI